MIDSDKKLEQYENTAVEVANEMHNSNVRAINSKTVIESFPNVRLASEKKQKNVEGGWKDILPSLFLATSMTALGFGLGYSLKSSRVNAEVTAKTIDQLIEKDLTNNQGFIYSGDMDFFAEMYSLRLFSLKPNTYITNAVKNYFKKCSDPTKHNTINYKSGGAK